jgi:predicted HTH transcriptional regulator
MAPIASIVGGLTRANTNFINDLKTFSSDKLPRLMMLFNSIRNEEKIEVLVFIEKLSDGPARVVRCNGRSKPAPMTNMSSRRHGLPQHYHSHHQLCPSELMQAIEIW